MTYEHILYDVSDKIATITLNRPDRMNAWTAIMERDVRHAMEAAAGDDNVRVIVPTGAGRGFCAGADMEALKGINPDEVRRGESISFDSRLPHRYLNQSQASTEIILSVTPPNP